MAKRKANTQGLAVNKLHAALVSVGYKIYWEYIDPPKAYIKTKGYVDGQRIEATLQCEPSAEIEVQQ